ncbi:MAG TPA: response regulator transcription factor [Candidatus Baltobacteraceae bacterium]|jgi:DNA-binding NarL/FixJ family response regulator|nr:response regulator transcription factor [Candidatus Baltobacteraceae bacterium]
MVCPNSSAKSIEVNVFLATENRLLRDTLARLLRKQSGIRVVGVVATSENLSQQVQESACGMVLTDFAPGSGSFLKLCDLERINSDLKIILIGMEDDPDIFMQAIRMGARGYVLKDASALEIVAAIRHVGRSEAICPPSLCMVLIEYVWRQERANPESSYSTGATAGRLTHRQVQLMNLVANGLSNKEIAASLNLSQYTVKNHLRRVMRQVEARNRYDAVAAIRASGLIAEKRSAHVSD